MPCRISNDPFDQQIVAGRWYHVLVTTQPPPDQPPPDQPLQDQQQAPDPAPGAAAAAASPAPAATATAATAPIGFDIYLNGLLAASMPTASTATAPDVGGRADASGGNGTNPTSQATPAGRCRGC